MREALCILIIAVGICGTSNAGVMDCLRLPASMQKACMDYVSKDDYRLVPALKPDMMQGVKVGNWHSKHHGKRKSSTVLAER